MADIPAALLPPPPPPPKKSSPPSSSKSSTAPSKGALLSQIGALGTEESSSKNKPQRSLLDAIKAKQGESKQDPNDEEAYIDEKKTQPDPRTVSGRANLLTFGQNAYGRLGTGDEINSVVAVQVKMLPPVNEMKTFKQVCIGAAHTYALTEAGEVYSWGKCHFGQLGHGKLWQDVFYPRKIENLEPISRVFAGDSFGIFLTADGGVYTLGCGHFGALGHGDEKSLSLPKKLALPNDRIVAASGGAFHTLFVTSDGRVLACGQNDVGQCGFNDRKQYTSPRWIEALSEHHIVSAACGRSHSVLLTSEGTVITFGGNDEGQLGIGLKQPNEKGSHHLVLFPELQELSKASRIAAKGDHSLILLESGDIFTFGAHNGVWHGKNPMEAAQPVKVDLDASEKPIAIGCGTSMSAIVTESGKLFTWGDSFGGKSGHLIPVYQPTQVESIQSLLLGSLKPVQVDCGSNSTVVLIN